MLNFDRFVTQVFSRGRIVLLCSLLLGAQVLEAGHAEEPDCNELTCLFCHANAEEDSATPNQFLRTAFFYEEENRTFSESSLSKAPDSTLSIRAPPKHFR